MLTFDEAAHQYFWSGRPVPNVTRIIGHLSDYSHIPPDVLERARQEGIAVHKMVESDCKGTLVDLPEWMFPHYDAWHRFKRETGFEHLASERQMYHERLVYAGTADLFGVMKNIKAVRGITNIDVKRSLYGGPAIGLQTAAYAEMWNAECEKGARVPRENRFALVLKPNATYSLTRYTDGEDYPAFLACLQQWKWREKHYGNGNG